jgi:hypothetical protein
VRRRSQQRHELSTLYVLYRVHLVRISLGLHALYYILHRDVDNIQHHVHCIV